MNNQPQQRFCATCGQALPPGVAYCVNCGAPVTAPSIGASGQFPGGAQPGYSPSSMQTSAQAQDDPLLAGLAAGSVASQLSRNRPGQTRRPRSRLRGCGCLLLTLAVLAGPFIGVALTTGRLRLIFIYVAGGLVLLFCLLILLGMLTTRRGREVVAEGCTDGCLDAIFGGLLGGG